jgi:arsenate reductase (thioredoxin)
MNLKKIFYSVFLLIIISSVIQAQTKNIKAKEKSTILFVCEHGAARSTIAALYFNKIAKEKRLNYTAVFRGTDPDTLLTPGTKKGLAEDGFDVSSLKPLLVTSSDINNAFRVVTFDCMLPEKDSTPQTVAQWNGIPPISKDYKIARDQIVEKVEALISELPKKPKRKRKYIKTEFVLEDKKV